ncbi:hypothetical protein ACP70R_035227 [Stipagrostis hirtigluma subsp. patula]
MAATWWEGAGRAAAANATSMASFVCPPTPSCAKGWSILVVLIVLAASLLTGALLGVLLGLRIGWKRWGERRASVVLGLPAVSRLHRRSRDGQRSCRLPGAGA